MESLQLALASEVVLLAGHLARAEFLILVNESLILIHPPLNSVNESLCSDCCCILIKLLLEQRPSQKPFGMIQG